MDHARNWCKCDDIPFGSEAARVRARSLVGDRGIESSTIIGGVDVRYHCRPHLDGFSLVLRTRSAPHNGLPGGEPLKP